MIIGMDCGNSTIKIYYFENKALKQKKTLKSDITQLKKFLKDGFPVSVKSVIISSVVKPLETEILRYCRKKRISSYSVGDKKFPPLKISYKIPDTLGADRILNCASAMRKFPAENIIIADAGTAVNIEVLSDKGEFLGGMIFPGPQTAADSLYRGTDRLPLTDWGKNSVLIGRSTDECISSGIFRGWSIMISGLCDAIADENSIAYKKILTGGYAEMLRSAPELENFIFIEDFQAEGFLNIISWLETGI
ncbi:MAG: type III pantothenate kinase [Spirochaetes bacterium]|nr:type III pantothenate kinase [Spirochaetota bacterium]